MKIRAVLALCLAACSAPPEILPPPFDGKPQNQRLFFPTGIAVSPQGHLLVANGNFDHRFDAGSIVTIDASWLAARFAGARDCSVPTIDPADPAHAKYPPDCDPPFDPNAAFRGAAMIGNYAGPLLLDTRGASAPDVVGIAYTGSRDTSRLNGVALHADGTLTCPGSTATDCRRGVNDLATTAVLEGPFSIVSGSARLPGDSENKPVLFVASLTPHIDELTNGVAYTSAIVAALDPADPSRVLFSMLASNRFIASGTGVGPMIFDADRRRLLASGCYQRFGASAAGEPSTVKCNNFANQLRILDVDAAATSGARVFDLTAETRSTDTAAMVLSTDKGSYGPLALWTTVRNSNALLEIALSDDPAGTPHVRTAVPLPLAPADLKFIPRDRATYPSDLIAVLLQATDGALAIHDGSSGQVLAQVNRLGNTPWKLELLPGAPAGTAWVVASIFGDCRLALVEVPLADPWNARLKARVGTCPP